MAFEALLEEYERRRAKALAMGGEDKIAKRKARGQLNARERVAALVDAGSFIETGLFGPRASHPEQADETACDGKIAGLPRSTVVTSAWW